VARTFKPKMPSSKFGRAVARRAVKVDAVLGSANPKAFGNDIRFYIERGSRFRKRGSAGVFAPWAPKNFNPMVGIHHPANMRLNRSRSTGFVNLNTQPAHRSLNDLATVELRDYLSDFVMHSRIGVLRVLTATSNGNLTRREKTRVGGRGKLKRDR
jgi:hypothetical protein